MITRKWAPRLHKWLALIVGMQLLAWMVSGLFMTIVPISQVRGEHNIRKAETVDLRQFKVISVADALSQAPKGIVERVELRTLEDHPAYEIAVAKASPVLVDATTGALLSPINKAMATRIAARDFLGRGRVKHASLISDKPPIEFRGTLPVWQISFDDLDLTNVYVSATTGKVLARRTETWRMYDFLWSLHIMDYRDRENFNNPLIVSAALLALTLAISGLVMLYLRFSPALYRRFRSGKARWFV